MDQSSSLDYLKWAKSALQDEAQAIIDASLKLDDSFCQVVDLILKTSGKVILTGLGKSGHVARKVSATLSSTGTSSVYLHPTEALHGDLGMISPEDCLIAIAFGGETKEVVEVAKFAKRLDVPVIALTGKKSSTLAALSDYILDGSVSKEACPLNLAPTSSSTVALALGDALAVTLMQARGFNQKDFALFHPSGSLGIRLSLVKDKMLSDFNSVSVNASFMEILDKMSSSNIGIIPVFKTQDSNTPLVGCITDGDLRRAIQRYSNSVLDKTAQDVMSLTPKTINENKLTMEALKIMEANHITSLFVVNQDQIPIGIIRMQTIIKAKG